MEREQALQELSTAYAVALRLREDGANDAIIAKALGLPVESVGNLLEIAESKLHRLIHADGS